MITEISR